MFLDEGSCHKGTGMGPADPQERGNLGQLQGLEELSDKRVCLRGEAPASCLYRAGMRLEKLMESRKGSVCLSFLNKFFH